jgi:hypothetical protein
MDMLPLSRPGKQSDAHGRGSAKEQNRKNGACQPRQKRASAPEDIRKVAPCEACKKLGNKKHGAKHSHIITDFSRFYSKIFSRDWGEAPDGVHLEGFIQVDQTQDKQLKGG